MTAPVTPTQAVQASFLRHAAALRGFLFGLLADHASADDVFQDVFLTVTENAHQYRPDGNFLAWARGIARNKVLEHLRKGRRLPHPFDEGLVELLADSAGQADDSWHDRRTALAACIRELAPRARQILELRYADTPVAPPDIARQLSWTVNAVHVALARARKSLQTCTTRRLAAKGGLT